jgi:uncharacterized membrane protein
MRLDPSPDMPLAAYSIALATAVIGGVIAYLANGTWLITAIGAVIGGALPFAIVCVIVVGLIRARG